MIRRGFGLLLGIEMQLQVKWFEQFDLVVVAVFKTTFCRFNDIFFQLTSDGGDDGDGRSGKSSWGRLLGFLEMESYGTDPREAKSVAMKQTWVFIKGCFDE
ncbi:hypothetical protein L2E82_17683 [Cichorium intybus]|uniref:Uncharacterized protein n=1 Tax=Cichorium intybus TaxID=13427 RepID=A0ACB9FA20_CICIN|nr:hypothetical protein L2E82_17683 [Cichorium intybus]